MYPQHVNKKQSTRKSIGKMIKSFLRKISFKGNMDNVQQLLDSITKDVVAYASAARYDPQRLQTLGLQIVVNTSSSKSRFLGDPLNPIYPEIVIWSPETPGSQKGKAVLVESVETITTLNSNPINKWQFFSHLPVIFNLIVPQNEVVRVRNMLTQNGITPTNLLQYVYDTTARRYVIQSTI